MAQCSADWTWSKTLENKQQEMDDYQIKIKIRHRNLATQGCIILTLTIFYNSLYYALM